MDNDVIKLNKTVNDISDKISELAGLGRDGFNTPLVMTPDELTQLDCQWELGVL